MRLETATAKVSDLAGACRRDIDEGTEGVKDFARKAGLTPHYVYARLEGYQPVSERLLKAVVELTGGKSALAVIETWRRRGPEPDPAALARDSGELLALVHEDLADDGRLNCPRTVMAAQRMVARSSELARGARAGVLERRRGGAA